MCLRDLLSAERSFELEELADVGDPTADFLSGGVVGSDFVPAAAGLSLVEKIEESAGLLGG